ncbi:MAG: cbb3-type cytochrome c oxidase subunit I, partial [Gemmataceae bacterium]
MSSASEKTLPTETSLIRAHTLMALAMAGWSALLGVILAAKFSYPDMMSGHPWFTWGRIRYAHTQGIFFGWLGNAFLAFLYFAVPRLAERPVLSRRLGWLLFFLWNFLMVLPGWVLLHAGRSQPLEWGEFPREIDAIAVASLALCLAQFVWPLLRASWARLYVSGWYIVGGLVFTTLAYPVGNMVPEFEPGARGATYSGLWIHDAIGLYVTPLALAIAYLVIPLSTRRPIFSHFLSLIGFWLLFLVYPLNGTHHYVFSSIPMEAQKAAIVASVYLGVDVLLVVTNLLLSLRGQGGTVARDIPLRFVWVGVICYLVVSLQGSLHALMPVNRFVHFTDWVIGHAHLALVGFASFTAIGGLLFVHQRLPGVRYHPGLAGFSFWMLGVSLAFMVLDLTVAGLIQGQLWHADVPWMDSVRASQPYWLIRSVSGSGILGGFITLFLSMVVGPIQQVSERPGATHEDSEPATEASSPVEADPVGLGWLTSAHVILAIAGVGFFALSFLALAVWPNRVLQEKILADLPSHLVAPSAGESRGRAIFIREGCGNCHSQLIRFTEDDVRRFGPPSQAWESARDFPQLWGTRRIGPDLARERG